MCEVFWADGWFGLNKTCAFLGNDYDFTHGKKRLRRPDLALRLRVQAQIVDLIENEDVDTFLVGEIGGFEEDAYESVLEVKKSYPDIKVILVISCNSEYLNIRCKISNPMLSTESMILRSFLVV